MAVLTDIMANGIQPIYESLCSYLKSSPASVTFSLFFSAVAILNIIRGILIWYEKKSMASNQRCKYLITNQSSSDCSIPSYWQGFHDREDSCAECPGKTFDITNEEAMERAMKGAWWKCIIILMANWSRNILPYASFLYTLIIAIFET